MEFLCILQLSLQTVFEETDKAWRLCSF